MSNKSLSGSELKSKLLAGITKLNDAVSSTLGPSGRNVIIENSDGTIHITKDGVTVAKSFKKLDDPVENIGVQLIKKVSEKSVESVGDGTTTSTLLATEIVSQGIKAIQLGSNPIEVSRGIQKSVKKVVEALKNMSEDIVTQEQIKQVAFVSSNSDTEISNLITNALDKVGEDGIVTIEESKTNETSLEIVEGMMLERGLKSPYLVTKNDEMCAILDNPLILLYDDKILSNGQIVNSLQYAAQNDRSLLIISEDIDGEALAMLIVNKMRGTIKVAAIKAPDYGDRRTAILEDIAVLTGGTVISSKKGHKLDKLSSAELSTYFGSTRLVNANMKETIIIDGKGSEEKIAERLAEVKTLIEKPGISSFEKQTYQDRLGKMTGGVAIINVGGMSEIEMKEKKDRVDDALHATKAALLEGIVPGGGMALIRASFVLKDFKLDNAEQELGKEIVRKSLYAPFKKILNNSGIEDHYSVLSDVNNVISEWNEDGPYGVIRDEEGNLKSTEDPTYSSWFGFNVKTQTIENFKLEGILDPTKVTRTALENAASVASTILTTESLVYNEEDKKASNSNDSVENYM